MVVKMDGGLMGWLGGCGGLFIGDLEGWCGVGFGCKRGMFGFGKLKRYWLEYDFDDDFL